MIAVKLEVEQIDMENEEEVIVRCHYCHITTPFYTKCYFIHMCILYLNLLTGWGT